MPIDPNLVYKINSLLDISTLVNDEDITRLTEAYENCEPVDVNYNSERMRNAWLPIVQRLNQVNLTYFNTDKFKSVADACIGFFNRHLLTDQVTGKENLIEDTYDTELAAELVNLCFKIAEKEDFNNWMEKAQEFILANGLIQSKVHAIFHKRIAEQLSESHKKEKSKLLPIECIQHLREAVRIQKTFSTLDDNPDLRQLSMSLANAIMQRIRGEVIAYQLLIDRHETELVDHVDGMDQKTIDILKECSDSLFNNLHSLITEASAETLEILATFTSEVLNSDISLAASHSQCRAHVYMLNGEFTFALAKMFQAQENMKLLNSNNPETKAQLATIQSDLRNIYTSLLVQGHLDVIAKNVQDGEEEERAATAQKELWSFLGDPNFKFVVMLRNYLQHLSKLQRDQEESKQQASSSSLLTPAFDASNDSSLKTDAGLKQRKNLKFSFNV